MQLKKHMIEKLNLLEKKNFEEITKLMKPIKKFKNIMKVLNETKAIRINKINSLKWNDDYQKHGFSLKIEPTQFQTPVNLKATQSIKIRRGCSPYLILKFNEDTGHTPIWRIER